MPVFDLVDCFFSADKQREIEFELEMARELERYSAASEDFEKAEALACSYTIPMHRIDPTDEADANARLALERVRGLR